MKARDIVCVAPAFWRAEAPLNVHHVMGRLAGRHRILYIESLGLRAPAVSGRDWRKVLRRLLDWLRGLQREREGLYLLSPLVLPWHGNTILSALNRRLLVGAVRRAMRRLGMERPLLWVFLPTGEGLAGALEESLIIYHCVDAYAENPGVDRDAILALEARLLARANLVFATSRELYETRRPLTGRSLYLPNVADAPHFAAGGEKPVSLASLGGPLLGYVGNLAGYKVDLDLLANLARRCPDWQFCLVGPEGAGDWHTDLSVLRRLPNIHCFGPRPFAELPAWVAAFDLCLIPFHINASTRASFPLKFYEYMAAGKEIVTTPLPALADYHGREDLCRMAVDADGFIAQIKAALSRPQTEALRVARREEALRHSWEPRMVEIEAAVDKALVDKEGA